MAQKLCKTLKRGRVFYFSVFGKEKTRAFAITSTYTNSEKHYRMKKAMSLACRVNYGFMKPSCVMLVKLVRSTSIFMDGRCS